MPSWLAGRGHVVRPFHRTFLPRRRWVQAAADRRLFHPAQSSSRIARPASSQIPIPQAVGTMCGDVCLVMEDTCATSHIDEIGTSRRRRCELLRLPTREAPLPHAGRRWQRTGRLLRVELNLRVRNLCTPSTSRTGHDCTRVDARRKLRIRTTIALAGQRCLHFPTNRARWCRKRIGDRSTTPS